MPKETQESKQVAEPLDQWSSYQLLPDRFVKRTSARRLFQFWSALLLVLFVVQCGVTIGFWARGQKLQARNADLVMKSKSLRDVQNETVRMEHEIQRRNDWINAIDSAKPDDAVLQTLLAVAAATKPVQDTASVDSIHINLPLEHSADATELNEALPHLAIRATIQIDPDNRTNGDLQSITAWVETLNQSERIETAVLQQSLSLSNAQSLEIEGQPRSTKVVP